LWQRVLGGERLPKHLSRHPKCEGAVEEHRNIALDVRELIRKRVFDHPVGSEFSLNLAYPWLRVMRLNSSSLDLQHVTARIVTVPLVRADCGAMGERSARCTVVASACFTISSQGSVVASVMASDMLHSAPVASAERRWPSGRFAASLEITGSFGPPTTRRSRAACGGGQMRATARRWSAKSTKKRPYAAGHQHMVVVGAPRPRGAGAGCVAPAGRHATTGIGRRRRPSYRSLCRARQRRGRDDPSGPGGGRNGAQVEDAAVLAALGIV
jgi:hypothetical protein